MNEINCPFCKIPPERVVEGNEFAILVRDSYPLTPGHSLVIPRRHVQSIFDVVPEELQALWKLVEKARALIDDLHRPANYNLGINDGPAAGQSVPHLHVHVIPRYRGDVVEPRGGVRWIIPERAAYWEGSQ